MHTRLAVVHGLLWGSLLACGQDGAQVHADSIDSTRQDIRWSANDAPQMLGTTMELRFDDLPRTGRITRQVWPGPVWPAQTDSVNHRWDGADSLSAVAKYAAAFGFSWGAGSLSAEDIVSRAVGVDSQREQASCRADADCHGANQVCGKRAGRDAGYCVSSFTNLSHGWIAAALNEPEPQRSVTQGGVTFKVNDIKALLALLYSDAQVKVVSLRCDRPSAEVSVDEFDRPTVESCADTNAGTFHVFLSNFIGLHQRPFVEDRKFDDQIANHPVRGYQVLEAREVGASEANQLIGDAPGSSYQFNATARRWVYVRTRVDYINDSKPEVDGPLAASIDAYAGQDVYEYVLELDASGRVQGGEWVGGSKRAHPDFLWIPATRRNAEVAGVNYDDVKGLLQSAVSTNPGPVPNPDPIPNPDPTPPNPNVTTLNGAVARGTFQVFTVPLTAGRPLIVETASPNNIDLYVRAGVPPTLQAFDFRSVRPDGNEGVRVNPNSAGTLYVGVFGVENANFTLRLYYTSP